LDLLLLYKRLYEMHLWFIFYSLRHFFQHDIPLDIIIFHCSMIRVTQYLQV